MVKRVAVRSLPSPRPRLALADTSGSVVQTKPHPAASADLARRGADTSGSLIQGSGALIDVALTANVSLAQATFLSTIAGISQDQTAWGAR